MQMVIDLPEKTIAHIRSAYGHGKGFYPLNEEDKKIVNDAIYFCTPLPKEHGRLKDIDAFITKVNADRKHSAYLRSWTADDVLKALDNNYTPIIIEEEVNDNDK